MNNHTDIPAPSCISDLQHEVDRWITTLGGGYFSPLTNAVILAEETGEVARIMARRYGDQKAKPTDNASLADLSDELADLLWVLTAIANQTGIDLAEAVRKNFEKKYTRDLLRFKTDDGHADIETL